MAGDLFAKTEAIAYLGRCDSHINAMCGQIYMVLNKKSYFIRKKSCILYPYHTDFAYADTG